MLDAIFGFRGRLGRLAFIGWTAVAAFLVFVIAVSFLVLGAALSGVFSADGAGPYILGILTAASAAIIGIWTALALQAKRIRDMGFNALPWMIGVSAVMIADQWVLTHFTDVRFFPPLAQYTPLGGLAGAAYMIVLLCWPGAAETAASPVAARQDSAPMSPMPSSRLLATPSETPGRTQFGLRN